MKHKALFLDRDGVINVDKAYVYLYEDIVWVEGIFELIQFANAHDFLVIVLTNQSGVAQNLYREEDVIKLHAQMNTFLQTKNAFVDDWFYCLEYESGCRKPAPGMMIKARDKYHIDLSKSFMIGDKPSDILEINGPTTFLLQGNYSLDTVVKNNSAEIFTTLFDIQKKLQCYRSE